MTKKAEIQMIDYSKDEGGSVRTVNTLAAMARYGGHFAAALSVAWQRADGSNHRRLLAAFPDLYATYAEMAAIDEARKAVSK